MKDLLGSWMERIMVSVHRQWFGWCGLAVNTDLDWFEGGCHACFCVGCVDFLLSSSGNL